MENESFSVTFGLFLALFLIAPLSRPLQPYLTLNFTQLQPKKSDRKLLIFGFAILIDYEKRLFLHFESIWA